MGSRGNSSDLRRLSPLRAQDLKWSSRSDICLRCFVWRLSHPGSRVQDAANLLTGPDKKKHQATLESIDESELEYSGLKNRAVDLESCIGYTVRAPYIIYNAREFIKEHGLDIAKVNGIDTSKGSRKLKFTNIKNERGQTEDVVMARAGPRKLGAAGGRGKPRGAAGGRRGMTMSSGCTRIGCSSRLAGSSCNTLGKILRTLREGSHLNQVAPDCRSVGWCGFALVSLVL